MDANSLAGHASLIRLGLALGCSVWGLSSAFAPKQQEVTMTSLFTKSLIVKSLVRSGIVVASLALAGNVFAADGPAATAAKAAHASHTHLVAQTRHPAAQQPVNLGQLIQGLFGGGFAVQETGGSGSYDWSPSFDYSSPTVDVDNSQSQAAIDASDQAMQQEDQSLQDLDASIAAAEQQNDAANAATLQTEINAGM